MPAGHVPPLWRARSTRPLVLVIAIVAVLLSWLIITIGPAHAAPTLLSQGKTATASSTENATFPASAAR